MRKKAKRRDNIPITVNTLTPGERLDAICFAARQAGKSYGKYKISLTETEKKYIYTMYAEQLEKRRRGEI